MFNSTYNSSLHSRPEESLNHSERQYIEARKRRFDVIHDNVTFTKGGCWIWTGHMKKSCSGKTSSPILRAGEFLKKPVWVKQMVFKLFRYKISTKCRIINTCSSNRCVNPDHLIPLIAERKDKLTVTTSPKHVRIVTATPPVVHREQSHRKEREQIMLDLYSSPPIVVKKAAV